MEESLSASVVLSIPPFAIIFVTRPLAVTRHLLPPTIVFFAPCDTAIYIVVAPAFLHHIIFQGPLSLCRASKRASSLQRPPSFTSLQ